MSHRLHNNVGYEKHDLVPSEGDLPNFSPLSCNDVDGEPVPSVYVPLSSCSEHILHQRHCLLYRKGLLDDPLLVLVANLRVETISGKDGSLAKSLDYYT